MATQVQVSLEEYLATAYDDVDREYVDGAVLDRPLPNYPHGRAQVRLAALLDRPGRRRPLFVCSETRMRLRPDRVRIPDLAAFAAEPVEDVPSSPPLLTLEILSPDDLWSRVLEKCAEYAAWGVRHVWIVDPGSRELRVYESGDVRLVEKLEIPDYDVRITASDLW